MATKLSKLVDWEKYRKMSEAQQEKEKHKRGRSKSGLDWECEDTEYHDEEAPKNWEDMIESEEGSSNGKPINEWGLDEEDPEDENRSLKALVKSIHKHAAELYNQLDDMDDPEDWVVEKAKQAAAAVAEIHSHIDYNKDKAEELSTEPNGTEDRGW